MIRENQEPDHGYPTHPAAEPLPLMPDDELQALAADIAKHGLREPIRVLDGQVIDGRHRLAACKIAGVKPVYDQVADSAVDDPIEYVLSINVHRRHLTVGQRALMAANVQICTMTAEEAATRFGVSVRSIKSARALVKQGDQQLVDDVRRGTTSLHAASERVQSGIKQSEAATELPTRSIRSGNGLPPGSEESMVDTSAVNVDQCLENAKALKEIVNALRRMLKMVRDVSSGPGTDLFCSSRQSIMGDAESLIGAIQFTIPYSICPRCNGNRCPKCFNRGWVNSLIDRELRA